MIKTNISEQSTHCFLNPFRSNSDQYIFFSLWYPGMSITLAKDSYTRKESCEPRYSHVAVVFSSFLKLFLIRWLSLMKLHTLAFCSVCMDVCACAYSCITCETRQKQLCGSADHSTLSCRQRAYYITMTHTWACAWIGAVAPAYDTVTAPAGLDPDGMAQYAGCCIGTGCETATVLQWV